MPVATDFDGNVRPVNGSFDIGAFEFSNASIGRDLPKSSMLALQRCMLPNQISGAVLRSYLQNNKTVRLYDCTGRLIDAAQLDMQGTCVVKNRKTGAVQRVFVIK